MKAVENKAVKSKSESGKGFPHMWIGGGFLVIAMALIGNGCYLMYLAQTPEMQELALGFMRVVMYVVAIVICLTLAQFFLTWEKWGSEDDKK